MKSFPFSSTLTITAIAATSFLAQGELCVSSTGNYTVVVDFYGGEQGTFFLNCIAVAPRITIDVNS
jgi:hypothetical protein